MTQAKRDGNHRASALGVSYVDNKTTLRVKINPVSKGLKVKLTA